MSYHYLKVISPKSKIITFLEILNGQPIKKTMRYCLTILIVALSSASLIGQDIPLFTHNYANPYIYNPAYAGIEGRPIVSLTHRQQWIGIEDAPVTSNLTFHTPVIGGFSMGLNVTQDKYGIFTSSGGLLSFAYSVPLGFNQYISFGLSGGAKYQNVDFSSLDPNAPFDPAFANQEATTKLDGNAGLAYHIGGFSLGVSLQNIFEHKAIPDQSFDEGTLGLIRNYIITADYMLYFGNDEYIFHPYGSYRSFEGFSSQYEAGGIFHLKHLLWVGGSYRQDFGIIGILGVKLKSAFSVSYAYEMPTEKVDGINKTSHEIHLNLAFGKKKDRAKKYTTFLASQKPKKPKKKKKKPKVVPVVEDTVSVEEPIPADTTSTVSLLDSLNQGGNKIRLIIANEPPDRTDKPIETTSDSISSFVPEELRPALVTKRGGHPFEIDEGHYVVVGAFGVAANAIRTNDKLLSQGYDSDFGYSSDKKLFYVYMNGVNSPEEARAKRDEIRKLTAFSKAWYLLVE
jgi:type IX secretion system PorP/SprF family membrane protein